MSQDKNTVIATNKKARFEYFLVDEYEAGLILQGTEIKAIRAGKVNLTDSFCYFNHGELYVKNLYIGEYSHGNHQNHEPRQLRKLLLKKAQLKKLERKVKEKGNAIVPYQLYVTERGFAKLLVALATGKKSHDKRDTIKDKDLKRQVDMAKKEQY